MKVLNCPHCGFPPNLLKERVGMKKAYYINCPIYACDMTYCVLGLTKIKAIRLWNKTVRDEQERIKK